MRAGVALFTSHKMNYFIIVFTAFIGFLGLHIWNLQTKNEILLKQIAALEATYSAVQDSQNHTLEYAAKELDSAKNRIKKVEYQGDSCEKELKSYKNLIRAF